jgi:rhamnogalacturonyl hydrolase YesR
MPRRIAKYAAISGEIKYLDKMDDYGLSRIIICTTTTKSYFRDDRYFQKKTPGGKKVFWSRGNGWVMGGLAKVLAVMPPDYPRRPFYENLFQEMAAKIKQLQLKKGIGPAVCWTAPILEAWSQAERLFTVMHWLTGSTAVCLTVRHMRRLY